MKTLANRALHSKIVYNFWQSDIMTTTLPSRVLVLLMACLCIVNFNSFAAPAKPAPAYQNARVITLTPPEDLPANGQVPFMVTGNALQKVGLRVWSIKTVGGT